MTDRSQLPGARSGDQHMTSEAGFHYETLRVPTRDEPGHFRVTTPAGSQFDIEANDRSEVVWRVEKQGYRGESTETTRDGG